MLTPDDLLEAGYYPEHDELVGTVLYLKHVDDQGVRLYSINITDHDAEPPQDHASASRWSVSVRLHLSHPKANRFTTVEISVHADTTPLEIEAFYHRAYAVLDCAPAPPPRM